MSAVRSGLFSLGGGIYKVLIGLVGIYIFARLLPDSDHGVYALILAIHAVVLPFLDFGLLPAYLKIEKVDKEVNSVFFTLNVCIGFLLTLLVILSAPIVAHYNQEEPLMLWYILAYSVLVLIISLGSQPSSQLIKQKRFKEIAIIDIVASTVALILGVVFALWDWAVWALLLRFIIDVTVKTSMQFAWVKPNYYFVNKSTIQKYWKSFVFGAEISVSRIITGFTGATDKFLFKSFWGDFSILGQYSKAIDTTAKADLLRNSLTTPALSYLTALGVEKSREYYFHLTQLFYFITALPILFFAVYGDVIAHLLLGDNWETAELYIRFFAFYGAGLVMRGLVNIFHINEFLSKRLYRLNLLFFVSLYSVLCLSWFFYQISALQFVQILSFATFGFWFFALFISLFRFTGESQKALRAFVNLLLVTAFFIGIGLKLRDIFQFDRSLEWLEAIIVGAITMAGSIFVLFIIDRKGFAQQFDMIYSRLVTFKK